MTAAASAAAAGPAALAVAFFVILRPGGCLTLLGGFVLFPSGDFLVGFVIVPGGESRAVHRLMRLGAFSAASSFGDIGINDWKRMIDTNLNGAFYVAREAFRAMREQTPQGGRIINNGSISAHAPRYGAAAYTAPKHAITGLTKSISLDGRPYNIACGQIDIGNTATDMTARMSTGSLQANGTIMPEPTFDVQHVVDGIVYMAGLPLDANVQFMTVMATSMPFIGRG